MVGNSVACKTTPTRFVRKASMSTTVEAQLDHGGLRLYAAAIVKDSELYEEHVVEAATEQVCKRFDTFPTRRYREHRDPQRRLLIFSELRYRCHAPPKEVRQPLQTSLRSGFYFA